MVDGRQRLNRKEAVDRQTVNIGREMSAGKPQTKKKILKIPGKAHTLNKQHSWWQRPKPVATNSWLENPEP